MQDSRPFNQRNVGNPNSAIKQNTVTKGSKMPSQKFTIPKNMGPANQIKRK